MFVILSKIAIIFAMVGVGFIANKARALPDESNGYLISLLMNITAPCMLLTSITGKQLTPDTLSSTLEVLAGTIIFFLVGMAVSYGIVKVLRISSADQGVYMSILTTVNTGFMGFPITKAAFGNEALYFMVVSNIVLNIYLYSLGILQINMGEKRQFKGLKKALKPMLNMCSLAAVLGIIMLFSGFKIPSFFNELLTGIVISLINLILWPALTFLAVNWLPIHEMTKLILVYGAAFPTAVIVVALAAKERKNSQLAAEGVAMTTLFSMATLPFITMLLSTYYGI
ncbi:AEC family transporter [Ihubacter massiliensis]|uniref:AEC family transporter n=1 Tax=Ihubacter massiliensis TaxID=1852367 RepID=UPI002096B34F|nr:AEC family transporter [Ihubacter massiliensis]MCO7123845.1 AEC family transporter [Ihubacter massiliensis]